MVYLVGLIHVEQRNFFSPGASVHISGLHLFLAWSALITLHLPWWICMGFHTRSALHTNCMIMFKCLRGSAPAYLADYCTSTSLVPGRSALRSAAHGDIVVPGHRTDWGLRSFAVAGPTVGMLCLLVWGLPLLVYILLQSTWKHIYLV